MARCVGSLVIVFFNNKISFLLLFSVSLGLLRVGLGEGHKGLV